MILLKRFLWIHLSVKLINEVQSVLIPKIDPGGGVMTVKIDLEKAYNKMRWEFVRDTLKELGFDQHFINIIWHCMASCAMQILINGERTKPFTPARGLGQDDPLLSYLFVLYMERLSQLIHHLVECRK